MYHDSPNPLEAYLTEKHQIGIINFLQIGLNRYPSSRVISTCARTYFTVIKPEILRICADSNLRLYTKIMCLRSEPREGEFIRPKSLATRHTFQEHDALWVKLTVKSHAPYFDTWEWFPENGGQVSFIDWTEECSGRYS
jgi:hypothetical protein